MKIVLASSEAVPFSKTGGLADVAAALPKALAADGHEVYLIAPHYPRAAKGNLPPIERTGKTIEVRIGRKSQQASVLQSQLPDSDVTVWLVDHAGYFDRSHLYRDNGVDYPDNCARFVFFSRAVMETVRRMRLAPDVIHSNDWQTGLMPALLDVEYRTEARLRAARGRCSRCTTWPFRGSSGTGTCC